MPSINDPEDSKVTIDTIITLWTDLQYKKKKLWLSVLSGSMLPLLRIGDQVLVQFVKPGDIQHGDIIVFKDRNKLIVHRVIRIYKKSKITFLQKGDSTAIAGIVCIEDFIGKVIAVRRKDKVIYLDHTIWKVFNHILTLFSISVYYFYPKSPLLRKITRFCFYKARSLLNHLIQILFYFNASNKALDTLKSQK